MIRWIIFFGLMILVLTSCKTTNLLYEKHAARKAILETPLDSAFLYNPNYEYRIRKDDKISLSVWGQDELGVGSVYGIYNSNEVYGKWLLVDIDGQIELPKVGSFYVIGLTVPELKDTLRKVYSQWIIKPIVDAKVLNKEISILGEVRDPQVIKVDKDHNTLLEVLSRAGGLEFYADLRFVKVLRQEGEHVRVGHLDLRYSQDYLAQNIQLLPGDVVIVPSKRYKEFDKRISTIIPFTTTITAAAILLGAF